jgi:protein-tyrosine phosphatase
MATAAMVDIHCHILPEVDDGAKTWDIAVEMCKMAKRDGIDHIVASPHANHEYKYDREQHQERLARLKEATGGIVELSLGCDFHLSYDNIRDMLENPARYCIGNTRYLLVEFSDFSVPPHTGNLLLDISAHGITPIITHPERNPILQRSPQMVDEWAENGALVQVTANSLTGRWGKTAKKMAESLAKKGIVHVLASDAHNTGSRPPILSEARDVMKRIAGEDSALAMVDSNPRAIVAGQAPPFP